MALDKFPFSFDAEKMGELFKLPEFDKMFDASKLPAVDVEAVVAAQQKNIAALVEANKVAIAGYQEIFKRQVALVEEGVAVLKDQMAEFQGQPVTADQTARNIETAKAAIEKAMADVKELADLAQKANTEAFEIVKARFEEAVAEFKDAASKLAA
ncbi:TIGR01841 family phasin [Limibaculum sp. FT325]|uniref:TIGR01841 family phasin n=1 Tax=Thermohalobaculum sediminis TaxID=2939436 RepID=UPI00201BFE75|nr:TIGR01841 family phasin [Limibaculum sediminis]MCL5778436.1 TIGR01841 family phasin [Limibaculum sediminis]